MDPGVDFGHGLKTYLIAAPLLIFMITLTLCARARAQDNGGPINLGNSNYPLRGGKHTLWDGGVRVMAWASGSMIPLAVRGTEWSGLAHSSDWYCTIAEGVAKLTLGATGPRPVDGVNLWPALTGKNLTSPRTEVIHQVVNNFTAGHTKFPAVIRMGSYKLFLGNADPGDSTFRQWPPNVPTSVEFGHTNGSRDGIRSLRYSRVCPALQHRCHTVSGSWVLHYM